MRRLVFLLGDQLDPRAAAFDGFNRDRDVLKGDRPDLDLTDHQLERRARKLDLTDLALMDSAIIPP